MQRLVFVEPPGVNLVLQSRANFVPKAIKLLLRRRGVQHAPPSYEFAHGQDSDADRFAAAPPGADHFALGRALDKAALLRMRLTELRREFRRRRPPRLLLLSARQPEQRVQRVGHRVLSPRVARTGSGRHRGPNAERLVASCRTHIRATRCGRSDFLSTSSVSASARASGPYAGLRRRASLRPMCLE